MSGHRRPNWSLDDELRADPDNAELALVYADALTARGDPRGELIVIQHHIERATGSALAELRDAEQAHLAKHADALLGPLAGATVTWQRGFARRVELRTVGSAEIEEALAHPSAAHVRELCIDDVPHTTGAVLFEIPAVARIARIEVLLDNWLQAAAVIDAIADADRPQLEAFVFGTTLVHERAKAGALYAAWDVQPLVGEESVAAFCEATPALRTLELRGEYLFEGLPHPALRELTCVGAAVHNLPFDYLPARVDLPALERFEQQLIVDEYRPAVIAPITLDEKITPKLVDLSIWGPYMRVESEGTILQHLSNGSILPQLRRLRIADLYQEVDGPVLEELAPQLRELERFHVDTIETLDEQDREYLEIEEDGDAFIARVRRLVPNLTTGL